MNSINGSFRQFDPDLGLVQKTVQGDSISIRQPSLRPEANFLETLTKSMEEVNEEQVKADQGIKDLIAGKSKNIHETMLQIQKAELSLKTMMQVRNKILEAYKEIMRMQV
ncbi:flagellar hook-basal body complex protein FliE [bacterium]|jgi:flagellar hook-basal body complex protein FliE|nr:flagellar hook-basal body complex protein FliE [bacterium]